MTQTIIDTLTETEAREHVNAINSAVNDIGRRLLILRERAGWQALGYTSFTAMLAGEFSFARSHLYTLMAAAPVQEKLSTIVDKPIPASTAAALGKFTEDVQPLIARAALLRYGKLTVSNVETLGDQLQTLRDTGHATDDEGNDLALEAALLAADQERIKRQKQYIADASAPRPDLRFNLPHAVLTAFDATAQTVTFSVGDDTLWVLCDELKQSGELVNVKIYEVNA